MLRKLSERRINAGTNKDYFKADQRENYCPTLCFQSLKCNTRGGAESRESFAKPAKTIEAVIPDKRSAIRNPVISNAFWIPSFDGMMKKVVFQSSSKIVHGLTQPGIVR